MTLTLINRSSTPMPRKFLQAWVQAVARELGRYGHRQDLKQSELTVVFVSSREGKKLNQTYRGRGYATDVLSFGQFRIGLAELVICPDVVRRQSQDHHLGFRAELAYMVLHGMLHLLGYDHETGGRKARAMYAIQDQIFTKLEALHSP